MASGLFTPSKKKIFDQGLDPLGDAATKIMLVQDTYTFDASQEFVDDAIAGDLASHELSATGYTGGFAGADRIVPANRASTIVGATVEFSFDDNTWTALGNGTNQTIGGVALIVEITNDAASPAVCWDELLGDVTTNGGNVTYKPSNNGVGSGAMFDW